MNTILSPAALDPRLDPPPSFAVRAVARLASWLLPLRGGVPEASALRRILVVRSDDRVGNALLTIPLVRALSLALPNAQIDLLLPSSRAQVASGLGGFGLLEFDKRDAFRRPLRLIRFLLALRARDYEVAIDAAHWHAFSLTSALLARVASHRCVVGSARGATCLYSTAVALPLPGTPEVAAKVALARGVGLADLPLPPLETALARTTDDANAARAARARLGVEGRFAAFNPGARKPDHRWAPGKFARLAKRLRDEHQLPSIVFWGPGEETLAREVCALSDAAALLAPATDLNSLAAHLRACSLAVTNDTGPMHLAVACGAPVLAIFLSEDGARWGHAGPMFCAVDARSLMSVDGNDASDLEAATDAASRLLALTTPHPRRQLAPPILK